MRIPSCIAALLTCGLISLALGAPQLQTLDLSVDGIARSALVYAPPNAGSAKLPLVFVFHGHGGNAGNAAAGFKIDELWPGVISVYPQGINTPGLLHDPEGRMTGWQSLPGTLGDRDLHFFDTLLARLEKDYQVDPARIYCTGHSNGAFFTYLLWLTRPKVFAAVAPCSGFAKFAAQLTPKPAMISGGSSDRMVNFEWQKDTMATVMKINGCSPAGTPWEGAGTLYQSAAGTPLVTYIYPGGHGMTPTESSLIVKFFKQHPVAAGSTAP